MRFMETGIVDARVIDPSPHQDERGRFLRAWCVREFAEHGLDFLPVQANLGFSKTSGTVRGMHFQMAPAIEAKLVRCTRGAVFDVVLDLRPQSPTFKDWISVILTAENRKTIYVPEGCAHGFLTLEEGTEVLYQMSVFQSPELARGVRFDDPAFRIAWPEKIEVISERDRNYPEFE